MKKFISVISAVCISGAILLSGCGTSNTVVPTTAETSPQQPIALNEITSTGVVESVNSRSVYTMHGFMIDRLYVSIGDYVTEGQTLAVLDTANVIEDLKMAISQQEAALEVASVSTSNAVQDARRMLAEANTNLANNTNPHILSAEVALNAAAANLEAARISHDVALTEYIDDYNPHLSGLESLIQATRLELETTERNHADFTIMHRAGIISEEALRQSENALTHIRNSYTDAQYAYESANLQFQRLVERGQRAVDSSVSMAEVALQAAIITHRDAQTMLNSTRNAARQEIEALQSLVTVTEASANLEQMELALAQTRIELQRITADTIITAPISGTLTTVIAQEGGVGMGLMFVIDDTDNLRIIASVREYDIAKVETGMEVTITTNATGSGGYTGMISRINPAATPNMPIVEFEMEVTVTSADANLRIGMNTRINIPLE